MNFLFLFFIILPVINCQIAIPRIEVTRRIRLNAVYVKWSVPNEPNYNLTKSRILLLDDAESAVVWPSQAVKVDKDGGDSVTLGPTLDKTYLECIEACLDTPQCRFIANSGRNCYLKSSVPTSGPCAARDECAAVLPYSNEAILYDLPMNTSFRIEVQVYDANRKLWSNYSQSSGIIRTDYMRPQLISPIEIIPNGVRLKWKINEASIINPTRYRISLSRKTQDDIKEWPLQMQVSAIDGSAVEEDKYAAETTSALDCRNACLRNPKCSLAVKDSKFCYLKALPTNPGTCGSQNGCWLITEYQPFAELANLPYDETYRFRVAVYDDSSKTWSFLSDPSEEFSMKLNFLISSQRIDQSTYRINFRQDRSVYPIARMRVLVSTNGSAFSNDVMAENILKSNFIAGNETTFSSAEATNLGRLEESKCLQSCYDDPKCVGIKMKDGNCYTTNSFDPFDADPCLSNEKCLSISNNGTSTVIQRLEASSNYKIRIEYITKFNTRGFSNIEEFSTPRN